jgi:hypothetical protein
MKTIISFLAIMVLTFICGYFGLPWYMAAVVSFGVNAMVHQVPFKAWLTSFFAIFILWGGLAFLYSNANEHILANKMAQILPLGGHWVLLVLVSAFIGALVAGFAGLAGSYLRQSNTK